MENIKITTSNSVETILVEGDVSITEINIATEDTLEIAEAGMQGIQGPKGDGVNDIIISQESPYSSAKTEERLGEEVGVEDFNFNLIFENQLSQGV